MRSLFQNLWRKAGPDDSATAPAAASGSLQVAGEKTPAAGVTGSPKPKPREIAAAGKSVAAAPAHEDIFLEFSDFLRTIPPEYLKDDAAKIDAQLRFDLGQIVKCLFHGTSTVPLAEVYHRVPEAFRDTRGIAEGVEIRFPWPKVVALINESTEQAAEGEETLLTKIKRRHDEIGRALAATAATETRAGLLQRSKDEREHIWFTRKSPQATSGGAAVQPPPTPSTGAGAGKALGRGATQPPNRLVALSGERAAAPGGGAPDALAGESTFAEGTEPLPGEQPISELAAPAPSTMLTDPAASGDQDAEELARARDEALLRVESLNTEHELRIAALTYERHLALDALQMKADKKIKELEAALEVHSRPNVVQTSAIDSIAPERVFSLSEAPSENATATSAGAPAIGVENYEWTIAALEARATELVRAHETEVIALKLEAQKAIQAAEVEGERRLVESQTTISELETTLATERARFEEERAQMLQEIRSLEARLNGPQQIWSADAPANVVDAAHPCTEVRFQQA